MTIYDVFFAVFSIIYLPYLVFKGKAHRDFGQRFGALPEAVTGLGASGPVWIHAVSVGEVMALKNFVRYFSKRFPNKKIVFSTTTRTGNEMARKIFGNSLPLFYFPLDFSPVVRRVVGILKPSAVLIMETEIWPNLVLELAKKKIPIAVINGRISDKSFKGYRRIRFLFGKILERIDLFCMQSAADAQRITILGAKDASVLVTGNMKFDIDEAGAKKASPRGTEKLIIAGSTHKGEEEILLSVYKKLREKFPDLRLLIAPRHIDRAAGLKKSVDQKGFGKTVSVLDTHGELKRLFSLATIVFMGGSLVKRGGHNIVEPAQFGKPIVFGPHMFNFSEMARVFLENNAALQIGNENELFCAMKSLIEDESKGRTLGKNALALIGKNKGATQKNIEAIERILHGTH